MALTAPERALFTAPQLTELDRMNDTRLEGTFLAPADIPAPELPAHRAATLDKWVTKTPSQLKAKVNMITSTNFSSDNNYNQAEQQEIIQRSQMFAPFNVDNFPGFLEDINSWAEISSDGTTAQQTGIALTYVKVNQFKTVGLKRNFTTSGANSNLTALQAGWYEIHLSMTFTGTTNTIYTIAFHVNDTEVAKTKTGRTTSAANDVGAVSTVGIIQLDVNDVIDFRVLSNAAGGANFKVQTGNLIIKKIK